MNFYVRNDLNKYIWGIYFSRNDDPHKYQENIILKNKRQFTVYIYVCTRL